MQMYLAVMVTINVVLAAMRTYPEVQKIYQWWKNK